jgi:hypothetical protein
LRSLVHIHHDRTCVCDQKMNRDLSWRVYCLPALTPVWGTSTLNRFSSEPRSIAGHANIFRTMGIATAVTAEPNELIAAANQWRTTLRRRAPTQPPQNPPPTPRPRVRPRPPRQNPRRCVKIYGPARSYGFCWKPNLWNKAIKPNALYATKMRTLPRRLRTYTFARTTATRVSTLPLTNVTICG